MTDLDDAVVDRAYRLLAEACLSPSALPRRRGLAYPFGVPDGVPEHEWLVSGDVMQALYNAAPPAYRMIPNPKSGDDGTTRLFGWRVIRDSALPSGTMLLRLAEALR